MTRKSSFRRAIRAGLSLSAVIAAACQPATRTDVAAVPAPATAADAHQHTPGMDMDSARAAPAAGGMAHRMDPDTRFMHHMIAHHAQALTMVEMVPSRGASQGLQLLAERIDISQKDEIALMRRWLGKHGKPVPEGDEHAAHMAGMAMPGMLSQAELARLASASGSEFERLFLEFMIKHHEGALTMVRELLGSQGAAQDSEMFRLVADIDADQRSEISRMRSMLNSMGARPPG